MPRSRTGEKLPLVTKPTSSPAIEQRSWARGTATRRGEQPAQPAPRPGGALRLESGPAKESGLLPQATTQPRPAWSGRDPRAELVAVKRQPGLEPQGVAGAEPRRHRPRGDDGAEELARRLGRHGALDAVLAGVAGAGDDADGATRRSKRATPKCATAAASGATLATDGAGRGSLDGDDRPVSRRVVAADRVAHRGGVRGVGHDVEGLFVEPPDDESSTTEPDSSSRCVYWARPGRDLPEVVREGRLQVLEGAGARDPHGAEVAHVEHDSAAAAREVLGERSGGVRQRHLPAAELDELRPERLVFGSQRTLSKAHPITG